MAVDGKTKTTYIAEGQRVKTSLIACLRTLPVDQSGRLLQKLDLGPRMQLDHVTSEVMTWVNTVDLVARDLLTYEYSRTYSDSASLR